MFDFLVPEKSESLHQYTVTRHEFPSTLNVVSGSEDEDGINSNTHSFLDQVLQWSDLSARTSLSV
jgi:hypothetical protein